MPMTRRGRSWPANPAIMPAWVEPVTVQTTMVSKKTPSSRSCRSTSRPVHEAESAERVLGGAGRDGVGLAAGSLDLRQRLLPRPADADVEAGWVEAYVGAHDPGQEDVADRSLPGSSQFTHFPGRAGTEAELGRDGRDLAGVVGLVAADRDQVSAPEASASGTMYSSLRVLLPPKARPELQSSRLAQIRRRRGGR